MLLRVWDFTCLLPCPLVFDSSAAIKLMIIRVEGTLFCHMSTFRVLGSGLTDVQIKRWLTRFSTVSTISRLLTSPTWISPIRTANFILIFRIGTDGLIIPVGRSTGPEPDIITASPETAAARCPWPGGGCRCESDTEPGIVTGLSLVISPHDSGGGWGLRRVHPGDAF